MNRFDTVMLEDGKTATVFGVERMLGKETGNILISVHGQGHSVIIRANSNNTNVIKKHVKPQPYPHIDDLPY